MRSRHSRRTVRTNRSVTRVGAWRLDWGLDDPDAVGGEDGVEGGPELGVAVADQERERHRPLGDPKAHGAYLRARRIGSVTPARWTTRDSTSMRRERREGADPDDVPGIHRIRTAYSPHINV